MTLAYRIRDCGDEVIFFLTAAIVVDDRLLTSLSLLSVNRENPLILRSRYGIAVPLVPLAWLADGTISRYC